jgi:protein-disulfide isomerase
VLLFRRSLIALILLCLGCSAQSPSPQLNLRIEHQVRAFFNIPAEVKIEVGKREPSDFPNYDKLALTLSSGDHKQTNDFLISKDDKTLIRYTKIDLSKDPFAEVMKKIDVSGRPVRGNKDAKVTIVNFDDFECPFCSRIHQTLFPGILKEYGDRVKIVYKDYPLKGIHPWAMHAAVDANCLAAQNGDAYWDFADYVHNNQKEISGTDQDVKKAFANLDKVTLDQGQRHNLDSAKLQACVKAQDDSAVQSSMHQGDELGVTATPTMFINGQRAEGAFTTTELRAILDQILQEAGLPKGPAASQAAAETPTKPASK